MCSAFQCSGALLAVLADPIPLGRHVRDGRYTLAVVKELSAGYLTAPPSLANKDVAKSFVVVSTRMWSSIYTQDKQLRSFFRMIRPTGYWPGPSDWTLPVAIRPSFRSCHDCNAHF